MATKQQVLDLHRLHPDWSCRRIAAEIGAEREYVYATFRRQGIKPPRAKPRRDPAALRAEAARLIALADKLEAK